MSFFLGELLVALNPTMEVKKAAKIAFQKSEELYAACEKLYEEKRLQKSQALDEYNERVRNSKQIAALYEAIQLLKSSKDYHASTKPLYDKIEQLKLEIKHSIKSL